MEVKHDQFIGIYENAISHEWCDKVIDYFKKSKKYSKRVTTSFTKDKACGLWDDRGLINEFKNSFIPIYEKYKYEYPWAPDRRGLFITDYKVQRTLPTEGFHNFHTERGPEPDQIYRSVVYTVYLNDVKEGGETEFLFQLKKIPPKKGTVCLFPAEYTHPHRGNTPYSNPKYIMTGWLELRIRPCLIEGITDKEYFEMAKFWK